jgi:hypothetical protein
MNPRGRPGRAWRAATLALLWAGLTPAVSALDISQPTAVPTPIADGVLEVGGRRLQLAPGDWVLTGWSEHTTTEHPTGSAPAPRQRGARLDAPSRRFGARAGRQSVRRPRCGVGRCGGAGFLLREGHFLASRSMTIGVCRVSRTGGCGGGFVPPRDSPPSNIRWRPFWFVKNLVSGLLLAAE